MLLWTWVYKSLITSFHFFRVYTQRRSCWIIVLIFLVFWEPTILLSVLLYIPTNNARVPFSPYPCQHLFSVLFWMFLIANQMAMRWCLPWLRWGVLVVVLFFKLHLTWCWNALSQWSRATYTASHMPLCYFFLYF